MPSKQVCLAELVYIFIYKGKSTIHSHPVHNIPSQSISNTSDPLFFSHFSSHYHLHAIFPSSMTRFPIFSVWNKLEIVTNHDNLGNVPQVKKAQFGHIRRTKALWVWIIGYCSPLYALWKKRVESKDSMR